jgi:hypothetical protein
VFRVIVFPAPGFKVKLFSAPAIEVRVLIAPVFVIIIVEVPLLKVPADESQFPPTVIVEALAMNVEELFKVKPPLTVIFLELAPFNVVKVPAEFKKLPEISRSLVVNCNVPAPE